MRTELRALPVGVLVLLCLAGCSSVPPFQVLGPQALDEFDVSSSTHVGAAPDGSVCLATETALLRIHPKKRSVEVLFEGDAGTQLQDVAVAENGLVYVTDRGRLSLFAGEQLHPLLQGSSVSQGWLVSTYGEGTLYLCTVGDSAGGRATLFHYNVLTKQIRGVAEFDQTIAAINAVRGGCLVATQDTITKIFLSDYVTEATSLMVCSIQARNRSIVSLAADETQRAVYFSTQDGTWAYVDGQVVPLLPAGGALAFAGHSLTIWDFENRQLLQMAHPAKRARDVLGTMRSQ